MELRDEKEEAEIALKAREAQIQQLYKQTWNGLTGVLVVALSICCLLWHEIPTWKLSLWAGVLTLITCARCSVSVAFHRQSHRHAEIGRWATLHVIGTTSSGLMWALACIFLWPENSPLFQFVWPICVLPLSASAVATYFTWKPSYLSFLLLSAVPVSIRLFAEGGTLHTVLGLLGLFFVVVLVQAGKIMNAASLQAYSVGIRNEMLNESLFQEKVNAEKLNEQLQQEIVEHTRSQEILRSKNSELEQLNIQLTTTKDNLELSHRSLEEALVNIKQLTGMLPICASCKSIRNDEGYWEQIESYIRDHSEVEFSHGICPVCVKKLYSQYCKESE